MDGVPADLLTGRSKAVAKALLAVWSRLRLTVTPVCLIGSRR